MHPGEQLLIARQGVRLLRRGACRAPAEHRGQQSAHYNFFVKIRDLQLSCNGLAGQCAVYLAAQNRHRRRGQKAPTVLNRMPPATLLAWQILDPPDWPGDQKSPASFFAGRRAQPSPEAFASMSARFARSTLRISVAEGRSAMRSMSSGSSCHDLPHFSSRIASARILPRTSGDTVVLFAAAAAAGRGGAAAAGRAGAFAPSVRFAVGGVGTGAGAVRA